MRVALLGGTAALLAGSLLVAPAVQADDSPAPNASPVAPTGDVLEPMAQADIVATLPPTRAIPARFDVDRSSTGIVAVDGVDRPEVCHLVDTRLPATREWAAEFHSGSDHSAIVIRTWGYGTRIDRAWREIRADLVDCEGTRTIVQGGPDPRVTISVTDRGDTIVQRYRIRSQDAHERFASVAVYQRVGDAVQMIEVGRTKGASRPGDAAAAQRIARTAHKRYLNAYLSGERIAQDAPPAPVTSNAPTAVTPQAVPSGTPIAVSIGDSYISGEAGRWGGNTISYDFVARIDRLGATAYWDTGTGESTPRCHRSTSAEIGFWTGAVNHACSGATTRSEWSGSWPNGPYAKPGIDFSTANGLNGQLNLLRETAKKQPVQLVTLSIGGNDLGFGDIVTRCVLDFATSPRFWPTYCKDSDLLRNAFSASGLGAMRNKVAAALGRTVQAMRDAGYKDDEWTLIYQGFPAPLPEGSRIRYDESNERISKGGCGVWNKDLDYIASVLPNLNAAAFAAVDDARKATGKTILTLDLSRIFEGRRLCETGTRVADEVSRTDLVNTGERINSIRTATVVGTDFFVQESLHPNYFGQMALRNCLRQAWNNGSPRSGSCAAPTSWSNVDANGEPAVRFTAR